MSPQNDMRFGGDQLWMTHYPVVKRYSRAVMVLALLVMLGAPAFGQFRGPRRTAPTGGPIDRGNVPSWALTKDFEAEAFSFARLHYTSSAWERSSFAWWTDYPDADLNLSFRLHQLTSTQVSPEPKVIEIKSPELCNYPWVFMSGAGNIVLTKEEAAILRKYLLNGGFLLIDDFWGQAEWNGVHRAMKQVFPEKEPVDLPRSHPIFHCVFDIPLDLPLQTPNMSAAIANRNTGVTWEDGHAGGNTREVHFRAIFDDKDRMMVMLCHNTDNGDGWEEESADPWYFHEFSEKKNYPLGFNIIFYSLTH